MKLYKYTIDKRFVKAKYSGDVMVGKKIPNVATGYIFAEDYQEAKHILYSRLPYDSHVEFDAHIEETSILPMTGYVL